MLVDDNLILKLENLSKLKLLKSEETEIKSKLEKMIEQIDKLNEFDTSGLEPMYCTLEDSESFIKNEISPFF